MLEFVTGSIFASPHQTLVNPVNCVGVMGKGLALEFKTRFPEMLPMYTRACSVGGLHPGKLLLHRGDHRWVLQFPTKADRRQSSTLDYIEAGLAKFVTAYEQQGITSAAFPRLGTGAGGLQWPDVEPLMRRYLDPLPIPVSVYEPGPERVVAVTGSREESEAERAHVWQTLDAYHALNPITLLVHGDATGRDRDARDWAEARGVTHTGSRYAADWTRYGKAAGPRRNRAMLQQMRPEVLIAFAGGAGTANCCQAAEGFGIRVERAQG